MDMYRERLERESKRGKELARVLAAQMQERRRRTL
jgi:hypothetical protein